MLPQICSGEPIDLSELFPESGTGRSGGGDGNDLSCPAIRRHRIHLAVKGGERLIVTLHSDQVRI